LPGKATEFLLLGGDFMEHLQWNLNASTVHHGQLPGPFCRGRFREAVEKRLQATAGDLSQGNFTFRRKNPGPLIKLIRELNLGSYPDDKITSPAAESKYSLV
jgi:hypothetical protein